MFDVPACCSIAAVALNTPALSGLILDHSPLSCVFSDHWHQAGLDPLQENVRPDWNEMIKVLRAASKWEETLRCLANPVEGLPNWDNIHYYEIIVCVDHNYYEWTGESWKRRLTFKEVYDDDDWLCHSTNYEYFPSFEEKLLRILGDPGLPDVIDLSCTSKTIHKRQIRPLTHKELQMLAIKLRRPLQLTPLVPFKPLQEWDHDACGALTLLGALRLYKRYIDSDHNHIRELYLSTIVDGEASLRDIVQSLGFLTSLECLCLDGTRAVLVDVW
jgi:hypothetical protein